MLKEFERRDILSIQYKRYVYFFKEGKKKRKRKKKRREEEREGEIIYQKFQEKKIYIIKL